MIYDFVRGGALYVVIYILVRHLGGKGYALAVKWLSVVSLGLLVLSAVAAPVKQFSDDLHGIAQTYMHGKSVLGITAPEPTNSGMKEVGFRNAWEQGSRFTMPLRGAITQPFIPGTHHGIDIAVNTGTIIKASRPGIVTSAGLQPLYGLTVIMDNGNGWETLYAHCSVVTAKTGMKLFEGDNIAESGGEKGTANAGNSQGPHLHFEIRYLGVAQNPANYLN